MSGIRLVPVPTLNIQGGISKALCREAGHVASGFSDHEGGSLDSQDSSEHPPLSNEATAPPPVPTSSATLGKSARDRIRRQKKRAQDRGEAPGRPYASLSKKHPTPEQIPVDFNAANLPAATGAFVSKQPKITDSKEHTLKELIDDGFRLVDWDGRTPTAILDQEKRIVVVLAGRPEGDDWEQVHGRMSSLLQDAAGQTDGMHRECRGDFVSLSAGVSYGGGQTAPGNLVHTPPNKATVDMLKEDSSFKRAAGFMSSAFAFYAPKLYREYNANLTALFSKYPRLKKLFTNSVFPTATFNCGKRVVTLGQVDNTNVPFGCAIFACGSYNPLQGGHLILFNLGLVIQFPPGSTVLVPSGTIQHGNVSIQPHETRQSFTQYCPGGLLSSPEALGRYLEETHNNRCRDAVGLFSKIDELQRDRQVVFNLKGSD